MLLTYVQFARNAGSSVHVQASGPAFPKGYASGDVDLTPEAYATLTAPFIPSMRGSGRLYTQATVEGTDVKVGGLIACSLLALVTSLRGPSPAYQAGQEAEVAARVATSEKVAAAGPPKPPVEEDTEEDEDEDEEPTTLSGLASKLATAILSVLRGSGVELPNDD